MPRPVVGAFVWRCQLAREVLSGLYQLKVPIPNNPIGYVLPYLIPGDDGYTLVDPGWPAPESVAAV